MKPHIQTKFLYKEECPTTVKKRYVNQYLNQKLFEINYINDEYVCENCESEIIDYLSMKIPKYDLVLVSDFGHGFITPKIISVLEKYSKIMAVNTQTNSANMGFNMITRYQKPYFVCLDETEARLTMQNRYDDIGVVAGALFKELGTECLIVTIGRRGSVGICKNDGIHYTPVFSTKVVDTVGAGDAVFSYAAACFGKGFSLDFTTFIGNAVGALAVQIVCNKRSVEKYDLFEFVNTLLKQSS